MAVRYTFVSGSPSTISRRQFALGATATAALAAAGLAVPASADEVASEEAADAELPDTITGASTVIDESLQLTQEEIHALACDYLKGWVLKSDEAGEDVWSYREMYAIATSYNNHPGLSQVEFVLDPETMHLVCSSEKGTEKCEHIKYNPEVVLYWYHQIPAEEYVAYANDYFNSYGVQFKGTARFLSLDEEGAAEKAGAYLETLYGAESWAAMPDEQKEQSIAALFEYNDWIEVEPTEVIVNSLQWRYNTEDSARPEWYDPEHISFGKSVRQVYYPA